MSTAQTGRTHGCSDHRCKVKILLANPEPSTHGPSVWTGRALQAKSDDLEIVVLRFCIRPLTERLSSWPSWISARARSHSRLGPEGHMGHLITNALARPFLHLLISTRRPRRESNYCFRDQPEPSPRNHRRSLARSGERRGDRGRRPSPW